MTTFAPVGKVGTGMPYSVISTKRRKGNKHGSALVGLIVLLAVCALVWKLL
jgi:hypothetical protein